MKATETQPIFLFSLPRSGSTLVQRVLATHEQIASCAEPWLLIPALYPLLPETGRTIYHYDLTKIAINDICSHLENGEQGYLDEVAAMARNFYRRLCSQNERYFLDKTPRYHLLADRIMRMFPDGRFIFLWRNPLSILASMMGSAERSRWKLHQYQVDLYPGMSHLIETASKASDAQPRCLCVRYEDLVGEDQGSHWSRIFEFLDLEMTGEMLSQFHQTTLPGSLGDKSGVTTSRIQSESVDRWKQVMGNPLRKSFCRRYLNWLGPQRLASMGYDHDALLRDLASVPTDGRHLLRDARSLLRHGWPGPGKALPLQ